MNTTAVIALAFWTFPIWGPVVALAYWVCVVRPVLGIARGR